MIKNIISDWSGTLSDDITPVYEAVMIVFEKLNHKRITFEKFRKEFEQPYMNFYGKYGITASKEIIDGVYSEAIHSVEPPKPFQGIAEFLELCKKKNIKMAVISSHPQDKIEKEIRDTGLDKYFIVVKGGIHDKTDVLLETIKDCGFNKKETAYVGDMTHDIEAGKKAGVFTVAVSYGYRPKEKLLAANPDKIIEKVEQLKSIL